MGFVRRRWREFIVWFVNSFLCGTRLFGLKRALLNTAEGIDIGAGTNVVGPVRVGNCSRITIGAHCWIGAGMTVYGDGQVTIGSNCDLAPDVAFMTGSHEVGGPERRAGKGKLFCIQVGDGCWLGAQCAIVNNVCVHDASVVAARALVTKDVEKNRIVAGVPATVIREINE